MSKVPRRVVATSVGMLTALAGVAGCGSGKSGPAHSAARTNRVGGSSAAAAQLPGSISRAGVLRIGTNVPFVPMEQYGSDGRTFTGIDLDLAASVASQLGLKVQIVNANWDGLIPSLSAGRYDMLASSFGDFVERQKVVDLVDMLHGGVSGIVKAADASKYTDATSLCGANVGAESGSATVAIAKTVSTQCQKRGKPAVVAHIFPTDANAIVALQSGRVNLVLDDRVVAQHLSATQPKKYSLVLPSLGTPFLYAFVVKKDSQLGNAVAAAMDTLITNGTYAKICAKYGITGSTLVTKATINAGTTSADDA
jgi:polar amino acid transport system substrate-binding protein